MMYKETCVNGNHTVECQHLAATEKDGGGCLANRSEPQGEPEKIDLLYLKRIFHDHPNVLELIAEVDRLTSSLAEREQEIFRLNVQIKEMWDCSMNALSTAHERGMRDAAEILKQVHRARNRETRDLLTVAYNAILSDISNHKQGGEACEWSKHDDGWSPSCLPGRYEFLEERCPCCLKPIKIKEG